MDNNHKCFQILSLDGGGIKGLFSAAVLAALEDDLGINIVDHFDLITGTSTGGIIALGLGAGLKPKVIVDFYKQNGPLIFMNEFWIRNVLQWFKVKYPQNQLAKSLKKCFGEKTLKDCTKRLVIPSYNLSDDDVYLFKTPHHERLQRDYKVPLWKVALATSAAPTFFPPSQNIDEIRLIDGGVWANNPGMVGVVEAIGLLNIDLKNIKVLSIGTSDPCKKRPERLNWGGFLIWAQQAIDVITTGQSIGVVNQVRHLIGEENFHRLNPIVHEKEFSLDKLNLKNLLAKASNESRKFCPVFTQKFQNHIADEFNPLEYIKK